MPTSVMAMPLDPNLVAAYQRDGVVVLKGIVDADAIAALKTGVEANITSPGPWANEYTPAGTSGRFFDDYVNWQRIPQFEDVGTHGSVPMAALGLMATKTARLFHEHVLVKEAKTREVTPWHHDDPYYGIDGMDNVSIWIPLDPIPESVALRFIVGSHLWNERYIPRRFADQSAYVESAQDFVTMPEQNQLDLLPSRTCPVDVGDAVAFHFRTLHAAPGTLGTEVNLRRAVSFRYVGDDAVFASRPWRTSPPLEGNGLSFGDALNDPRFPIVASL
ncbi:MAG: phytanoyl-CoA dioxygenase [Actinobacteria bacterium]|nr:MAG: phytanoyl-CoA dioxygenase [Actinomycetota bacterium]